MASIVLDLETPIRELSHMAVIARYYVTDFHLPAVLTEEERRDADRAAFAIAHVAEMAEALHAAYDRLSPSGDKSAA